MTMTPEHPRWKPYKLLLIWLEERNITMADVAEVLGLKSEGSARAFFKTLTMPVSNHTKVVALGVSAELLPEPRDRKPGPKARHSPLARARISGTAKRERGKVKKELQEIKKNLEAILEKRLGL